MRIPEEQIKKFQALYKKAFGADISSEEAQKQGLAVMRLMAIRQEEELLKKNNNEKSKKSKTNSHSPKTKKTPG